MNTIDQKFIDQAAAELRAEQEEQFMQRVRLRAAVLQETARRLVVTDFPTAADEAKAKYDALLKRQAELEAKPAVLRAAAEDEELRVTAQRIHELAKRGRMQGWLRRSAA
jgi:hypothetical protein